MSKRLFSAAGFVAASCAWWLGVAIYHYVQALPGPFDPYLFVRWDQMEIVYRVSPWMAAPFAALILWAIGARVWARAAWPPAWLTWCSGAAALAWTGFVFWRAHEQALNCALWAPRESVSSGACSLPHLLWDGAGWIALPAVAWLLLAAARPRSAVA